MRKRWESKGSKSRTASAPWRSTASPCRSRRRPSAGRCWRPPSWDFPPEKTEAFLDLLLEANTETFGPQDRALGKIHDTGEVVLQWRIPTRDVELDGFCAELEAFVNQVEQWRLALENFRPAAEEAEAAARDEEAPAMGLPASGFISV